MDGALIIDKPGGWTSHDVVARVRKLTGERRVGHTGTLDPFATGVLVVLLGRATRLAQFLSGAEKEYEAVIRFGYATDSGDVTGVRKTERTTEVGSPSPLAEREPGEKDDAAVTPPLTPPRKWGGELPDFQEDDIEQAMALLRGDIEQTPPMYSAKKIAGRKLYELARRGEEVKRQPVRVNIKQFVALSGLQPNEDGTTDLQTRVVCSAGTYIRTLAEDLGRQLDVGSHLAALRRTRAGQFTIDNATTLDELAELASAQAVARILISPDGALSHLPAVDLTEAEAQRVANGIDIPLPDTLPPVASVRLRVVNGNLLAVGTCDPVRRVIHPRVVIGR